LLKVAPQCTHGCFGLLLFAETKSLASGWKLQFAVEAKAKRKLRNDKSRHSFNHKLVLHFESVLNPKPYTLNPKPHWLKSGSALRRGSKP
jgi:hypothetical protein